MGVEGKEYLVSQVSFSLGWFWQFHAFFLCAGGVYHSRSLVTDLSGSQKASVLSNLVSTAITR